MSYGNLLFDAPQALKQLISTLVKENIKLIKAEWS